MKILLIYPYFIEERRHDEDIKAVPMGLYSVGAVLKENHYEAEILDWHEINRTPEKVKEAIAEKKPEVIGFSVLHGNRWGAIDIARAAKQLNPKTHVVFGGIGATFLWEHLLTHFPEVDVVVLGEGEWTFLNLVKQFEEKHDQGLSEIPGIAYRRQAKPFKTGDPEPIKDLDSLPIPAKHFTYQHVSSSRGCAWNCTFCGSPQFWGRKIRWRSPQNFVAELEMLYRKGVTFFYFSDDTFTLDPKRVIEICRLIIEKNLRIAWYAISRVDQVDGEMLYWMRRAGCIQISYGVESGSVKIRKALGKRVKTEHIKRAFALTTRYGILSRAYFIYGAPGETWQTIQETLDLMDEIKPLSAIFYLLDVFPGTRLYSELEKKRSITDDIWLKKMEGIMYFETDSTMKDDLVLDFGKRLRTAFYEKVHSYGEAIELVDRKDLYPWHADFCSRLGMTFSHGDYSRIEEVKEKAETADKLFKKALGYCPDHRAYLGLGIIRQRKGEFKESIKLLKEGLRHWPGSEDLTICLGINYMNLGDFRTALGHFSKFPQSKIAIQYKEECAKALKG
ncbi:MAG: cobalamin-binding radical domain protein [Deltaproteobacteria bacterium]|nr:cobalamin-binding radical domain protein [Deltaproteobacteria bacterium]